MTAFLFIFFAVYPPRQARVAVRLTIVFLVGNSPIIHQHVSHCIQTHIPRAHFLVQAVYRRRVTMKRHLPRLSAEDTEYRGEESGSSVLQVIR